MLIRRPSDIKPSEITPKSVYLRRREFMLGATALGVGGVLPGDVQAGSLTVTKSPFSTPEPMTPLKSVTTYNNFYEFGTGKSDPAANAGTLTTKPWQVKVDGLVGKPAVYDFDDLIKGIPLEERIYRLRCVEAWSMVIPWVGIPLSSVLAKIEPQASAKYVAFETLVRPNEMPGQRGFGQPMKWPYREGLRLDEAMHPLTILAVGLYGDPLPNQNGAPIRLVVPWKYGFKSIKSIVRISLVENQPKTSWSDENPSEYGFYSNVNPAVDHPRWSQATERRIGADTGGFGGLFNQKTPTLMFNGYADQVASLYAGMDLKANY